MAAPATEGVHVTMDPEVPGIPDSDTVYLGAVKSYNDRRGFGFVACAETAAEFGRDVYMAKLEAQMAAVDAHIDVTHDTPEEITEKLNARALPIAAAEKAGEKPSQVPRLAEEDLVRFKVKLSIEGFPQAVQVQKMRKFHGTVIRSPVPEENSGLVRSQEVAAIFGGKGEVLMPQEACGQLRLLNGDKVTFCLPEELDGTLTSRMQLEAKLVMFASSDRPSGSVLGCFQLKLPRPTPGGDGKVRYLMLDCHAFGSKVIMSGLQTDVGEAELMRFFSKQGATSAIVAHAKGCSFASVTFPSTGEVSTFLCRCAHAFADDKETRIATFNSHPQRQREHLEKARLPALPAPSLTPGEEPGSILVIWAPLQLAVGYVVELRPAGSEAAWAAVDGRFDPACSSCKVSGLRSGAMYEARMTYFASCGCRAEASEASTPCAPCSEHVITQNMMTMPSHLQQASNAPMWTSWPEANQMPTMPQAGPVFCPPASQVYGAVPSPGWRCVHGVVIPPPPTPEVLPGDEAGFSVAVRWPSVAHAAAYVVELREAGSSTVERFVRSAASATPGSLVELRVGGLRPVPGRSYMAQVRCVSACGCESAPSNPGWSPLVGGVPQLDISAAISGGHLSGIVPMQQVQNQPQWTNSTQEGIGLYNNQAAPVSNSPPQMPVGFAFTSSNWGGGVLMPDSSPLSIPVPLAGSPPANAGNPAAALAAAVQAATAGGSPMANPSQPAIIATANTSVAPKEVPLAPPHGSATAGAPLVPPPDAPPRASKSNRKDVFTPNEKTLNVDTMGHNSKELPPEVTGQEECLILD